MFRVLIALFVLLAILPFSACEDDFEVNAPWKQIGIAYMLIDKRDSVQYLKLNKAYLNDESNALKIAQNPDSLYFNEEDIEVTLTAGQEPIAMYRVKLNNKDSGVFAAPEQYVYRTPPGTELPENRRYRLEIVDTRTGYTMTSETPMVKDGAINAPFRATEKINFAACDGENNLRFFIERSMEIVSGRNVKFYDFDLVFNYQEYNPSTGDTTDKQVVWAINRLLKSSTTIGGDELSTRFNGEQFYELLSERIVEKAGVERIPGNVDFVFYAGAQDLYDYINVNEPSSGIVQKRPEFTNFSQGLGLFSSRTRQVVSLPLDDCSKIQLAENELTSGLGFVR